MFIFWRLKVCKIFNNFCLVAALKAYIPFTLGFRSVAGLSYHLLTATDHNDLTSAVLSLTHSLTHSLTNSSPLTDYLITSYTNNISAQPIQKILFLWPPLWSSDQSSWLQIYRSGFNSRLYQIFSEVVGLELGPISLMSTTEELLERNSSGSDLDIENMAVGIRHADHVAPSMRKSWHQLRRQARSV
jgi:hypothetical protein